LLDNIFFVHTPNKKILMMNYISLLVEVDSRQFASFL